MASTSTSTSTTTKDSIHQKVLVLVQLADFKSIDLFQQGYYQVKMRMYQKLKRNSSTTCQRIDASLLKIYPNNSKIYPNNSLSQAGQFASLKIDAYSCSLGHSICNWRCKASKAYSWNPFSSLIDSLKSVTLDTDTDVDVSVSSECSPAPLFYLSEPFYISSVDDTIPLDSSVVFQFNQILKLYPTDGVLHDDIYMDFELFFDPDDESPFKNGTAVSKQQRVIQVAGTCKKTVIEPQFHQIVFSEIYFSTLDIHVLTRTTQTVIKSKPAKTPVKETSLRDYFRPAKVEQSRNSSKDVSDETQDDILDVKLINVVLKYVQSIIFNYIYLSRFYNTQSEPPCSSFCLASDFLSCFPQMSGALSSDTTMSELIKNQESGLDLMANIKGIIESKEITTDAARDVFTRCDSIAQSSTEDVFELLSSQTFQKKNESRKMFAIEKMQKMVQFTKDENEEAIITRPTSLPPSSTNEQYISPWPKRLDDITLIKINTDSVAEHLIQDAGESANSEGVELIVFVHGILGHANDLRFYRNVMLQHLYNMQEIYSLPICLFSKCNQENTFDHLVTMGNNLAKEIVDFINDEQLVVKSVSFVCHSMGGIIARIAIRSDLLQPYREIFNSFTTLATPHLSLLLNNHQLMSSALSLYQSIYSSECIDQLFLRDHTDKRQCLLYHLAKDTTISYFKQIHLFASPQDQYVHFEGALVVPLASSKDYTLFEATDRTIYREMYRYWQSNVKRVSRYQVYFHDIEKAKLAWGVAYDPLGRQAHISIVSDPKALYLCLLQSDQLSV